MAEDIDLVGALDALEVVKGPTKMTCLFWQSVDEATRDATARAVQRVGHTAVSRLLRAKGHKVTPPDIKLHAAGGCDKCSQTS